MSLHSLRRGVAGEPDAVPTAPACGPTQAALGVLRAIVLERYGSLCEFVYGYVKSQETAADIVQDVFIRIWERPATWLGRDPVPYLYRAARNAAVSHLRHVRVRREYETYVRAEGHGPDNAVDTALEYDELTRAIARAVDELPDRCREVYRMSREQGMSHAEIARALGISHRTVEVHITTALRRLRTRVAPYL